jgi:DNA-binding response OmpR family regulator
MNVVNSRPLRLLVVDDIAENRTLLSRLFGKSGYEIAQADGGAAALDLIEQQRFDAVLLDIVMPGMDGLEVLKRIRKAHSQSNLPVIMVSGRSASDDMSLARDLGANDFITKPIDFSTALACVQSIASMHAEQEKTPISEITAEIQGAGAGNDKAAPLPPHAARLLAMATKFRREGNLTYAEQLEAKAAQISRLSGVA